MALASIAAGVAKFFSGGGGKEVIGFIRDRWPAKLSEAELAEVEAEIDRREMEKREAAMEWGHKQDQAFFTFTKEMEGTAADLKSIPFVGAFIIFLRGAFRPIFAYFTLYLDAQWFLTGVSGGWTEQQSTAMIVINVVVLVFFFGERTVKNLMPLIAQVFGRPNALK